MASRTRTPSSGSSDAASAGTDCSHSRPAPIHYFHKVRHARESRLEATSAFPFQYKRPKYVQDHRLCPGEGLREDALLPAMMKAL